MINENQDILLVNHKYRHIPDNYRIVGFENYRTIAMTLKKSIPLERFIKQGYVLPSDFPCKLDSRAFNARVKVSENAISTQGGNILFKDV